MPRPPRAAGESVLVVDDNADSRAMLATFLSRCGFVVYEAADGVEAIEAAVHAHPSVILMDLTMPRMCGLEATRHLKADARTCRIPVIALTAASTFSATDAREAGCESLVFRPCDLHELVSMVDRCLDGGDADAPASRE